VDNVSAAAECLAQLALHTTQDLGVIDNLSGKCFEAMISVANSLTLGATALSRLEVY
jgi:hypothetical protein